MTTRTRVIAAAVIAAAIGLAIGFAVAQGGDRNAAASPRGLRGDQVKVHGAWRIDVRTSQGKLVRTRRFENSLLVGVGDATISRVLGRTWAIGRWALEIDGSPGNICPSATFCAIGEPDDPGSESYLFKNLTIDVPSSGADARKIVLAGSFTANANTSITVVKSRTVICPVASAPCTGGSGNSSALTQHDVSPAIPVSAGQQVQVTVKISFS